MVKLLACYFFFPSLDYSSDYGEVLTSWFLYYHVFYLLFLKIPLSFINHKSNVCFCIFITENLKIQKHTKD